MLATMGEGRTEAESSAQVVRLWDTWTGKEIPIEGDLRRFAHTVVFHPNGRSMAGLLLPTLAGRTASGSIDLQSFNPLKLPVEDRMESTRLWDIGQKRERLRFDDRRAESRGHEPDRLHAVTVDLRLVGVAEQVVRLVRHRLQRPGDLEDVAAVGCHARARVPPLR